MLAAALLAGAKYHRLLKPMSGGRKWGTSDLITLAGGSLGDAWSNEASDFTPWLAQEENFRVLFGSTSFHRR